MIEVKKIEEIGRESVRPERKSEQIFQKIFAHAWLIVAWVLMTASMIVLLMDSSNVIAIIVFTVSCGMELLSWYANNEY